MIRSFEAPWVEDLYHGVYPDFFSSELCAKILRLFDHLNTLTDLNAIKIPGVDNFERFSQGRWSLMVDSEWRLVFKWFENDVYNLDLMHL